MARSYNIFKTLLLLFGLFHVGRPQTFASLSQNFCETMQSMFGTNLSCEDDEIQGQACFPRSNLCNGIDECPSGSDEGNDAALSSLECDAMPSPVFDCGNNVLLPISQLCDGIDQCANDGARPGSDEIASICDNKCLAPYYGSCDSTTICVNSRSGVNCGGCLPNLVDSTLVGQGACGTLTVASATFTEGVDNDPQVCATLSFPNLVSQLSIGATVTFLPGSAVAGGDFQQDTSSLQFLVPASTAVTSDTQCISFDIVDDTVFELPETFSIQVTAGGGSGTGTVTILDLDEPEFGYTAASFAGTENGNFGVVNAQVTITNGVGVPAGTSVTVTCSASLGGTNPADASDFSLTPVSVEFFSGDNTLTCPFSIVDDLIIEDAENFNLGLSIGAGAGTISATAGTAIGIINDDIPSFGFDPLSYTEMERSGLATVFVDELDGQTFAPGVSRTLTINSQTAGLANPATGVAPTALGGDFENVVNALLTVTSPQTAFSYTLRDDDFNEETEMLQLVLSPGSGGPVIIPAATNTAAISITDNDFIIFQFTMNTFQGAEGTPLVDVCVMLASGSPSMAVTVTLDPMPQSASSADFGDATMIITFPASSSPGTELCAQFSIVDDNIMEALEFFSVTGTPSLGTFGAGGDMAQVSILDNDDPQFQFTQQTFDVPEMSSPGSASIQLVGNTVLTSPISISVSTIGGGSAAAGLDFTSSADTLVFPANSGQGTTLSFNVPIVDDDLVENTEDINIQAVIQGNIGSFVGGGTVDDAQINIIDDDVLVVGFQLEVYMMIEDQGDQMVCLTAISGMLAPGVSVMASLTTSPGNSPTIPSATPGIDYGVVPTPETVTFTAGNTVQCVTLDIISDAEDEPDEQFQVNAIPIGGQISIPDPQSDVIITDDDVIVVQFDMDRYTVNEGGPAVMICLNLIDGLVGGTGLTINIQDSFGGTAELGPDFLAVNQNLLFPAGTVPGGFGSQQCFPFSPVADLCVEDLEDVILEGSAPFRDDVMFFGPGGSEVGVYIEDDDTIPVSIVPPMGGTGSSFSVSEDTGPVTVCIIASSAAGVLKRPVSVTLSTEDGTAIGSAPGALADYCSLSQKFIINPGEENMQMCVEIDINDDLICEGNEDFGLVLEPCEGEDGVSIASPNGMVTIFDNDVAEITAEYDVSVPENIGVFKIHILLLGQKAPGRQCVVQVSTMEGTAISSGPNADFESLFETVTLADGDEVAYVELEINQDTICEGTETFEVLLATSSPGCAIQDDVSPIEVSIIDDEIGTGGDDPHFSIVLPSGKLLCYTVQGEHGFSFNLISNKKMTMNARFVPDSRRSEVTWMGSMGIIVRDNSYMHSNATALRFEAKEKKVYIGDKVELAAKNIERMTFKNGKLMISEAPPSEKFKYPSIYVDLQDVEITFTMKFLAEHLDIYWHRTGGKIPDSHGIIGQFFRTGVEIDEVRKILIMPNKEPVPVMRRPVWSFMEREVSDDQLCWTAMNPGYQGEGLIDGTYYDYLVDDVMTSEFQFKKQ